jgi:ectoine hydroxylase-related dioxygenase (phytanoyl-CoA dioxygenase family)
MVDLPVAEDDIVIFPSKTFHGTDPNNTNGSRRDDDAEGHHGCGVSAANG